MSNQVSLGASSEDNSPTAISKDSSSLEISNNLYSQHFLGNVLQRNYVLNDSNALKKKLKHEDRPEPYDLGTEARDGSNVVIEMQTSFFEHVKSLFIQDLVRYNDIEKVDNAVAAKVSSSSGEAFVEFSLDITFKYKSDPFVDKLIAHTTSCRLMIQPVGPRTKLDKKSIPRFSVDKFILPWFESAYKKKEYNEKDIIEALHKEIKRLDLLKVKKSSAKSRVHSVASSEIKCIKRV